MTPDQLRALADALRWVQYTADWQACDRAADYLRAQADAQPVAWRTFDGEGNYDYRAYELNEDYADEWNRRNPNHVGWVEPLYTHPAPAAPQAEPKREPLPGLTPTHRCPACGAFWRQCDDNSWNLRSASCCGLCDAGRVELVRWLDEPKREPLTALLELAEQSDDCQRGTLSTSIVRELVIEALGIGGSDD